MKAFAAEQGYRPEKELLGQLMTQKLVRAVDSENQLEEVMTDFWFNHFNVSLTNNKAKPYLLSYERDAIRPHALGRFRDLLEATAKSPAMLVYLDNAQSTAGGRRADHDAGRDGPHAAPAGPLRRPAAPADGRPRSDHGAVQRPGDARGAPEPARALALAPKRKQQQGVNENYARELMELHTLGVDGGYTQQDVVEVARAFTGWTILPAQPKVREAAETRLARAERAGGLGFRPGGGLPLPRRPARRRRQDHPRRQLPGRPRHRGRRGRARPARRQPRHRPAHRRPSSPCASSPTTRRRRWSTG